MIRVVPAVLVLLALISLPSIRHDRVPGSVLQPSVAWAGGSPDETLYPPPTPPPPPPKKSAVIRPSGLGKGSWSQGDSVRGLKGFDRWELILLGVRASLLRF